MAAGLYYMACPFGKFMLFTADRQEFSERLKPPVTI